MTNQAERILRFPTFDVPHFISTRCGGVSTGANASLNLSALTGDEPDAVSENRHRVLRDAAIPFESLTLAHQVHDSRIAIVTASQSGAGCSDTLPAITDTDALITSEPGICICVLVADCLPVLLMDRKHRAVAAIHAGRRGIERGIIQATIREMQAQFSIQPVDLQAGLGPCIGVCCYPVDRDVAESFASIDQWPENVIEVSAIPDQKPRLNLRLAATHQLLQAGIPAGAIASIDSCTACEHDRFFSYRFDHGQTGRFGAGIALSFDS